jgi:hypothetical protein
MNTPIDNFCLISHSTKEKRSSAKTGFAFSFFYPSKNTSNGISAYLCGRYAPHELKYCKSIIYEKNENNNIYAVGFSVFFCVCRRKSSKRQQ